MCSEGCCLLRSSGGAVRGVAVQLSAVWPSAVSAGVMFFLRVPF